MTYKNKKYELTDETIEVNGSILHRIRSLRDFGDVRPGDLGGFIEYRSNLSHADTAWVYDNARVSGDGWVHTKARVSENAWISEAAQIGGYSKVSGNARVSGKVLIYGDVWISGDAWICNDAMVFGNCKIDQGIWNDVMRMNEKWYIVSTTLKKMLLG